ncbi:tetratricopeptide repeat protein [Rhodovibrio salinarum]|nr:tetratricopeptide repeat protein [Rhodovibrio salinarum]
MILSLLAVALLAVMPARSDQDDPRLDRLFDRLESATSRGQAQVLASRIWSIWFQHPNGYIEALLRQGREALQDDDLAGAYIAFDDVVRKAPDFAEAWNARATVNYQMGNYERSLADIRRTLTLEPRHFGALSGRGLCYLALDRPEQALTAFEASLAIHPYQPGVKAQVRQLQAELDARDL